MSTNWIKLYRPGYFGRRRDSIIADLNKKYGMTGWTLVWSANGFDDLEFAAACKEHYENSYFNWFWDKPEELDFVCSYGECMDNAKSNIQSGCDYSKQEAFSTHIQDIAVRNILKRFGRWFEGPADKILVIRSADSEGFKYGPGNIPYIRPHLIESPSLCPKWANEGSTEAYWQSNKYLAVREDLLLTTPTGSRKLV